MPNWKAIESETTGPTSRNTRPISRKAAKRSPFGAARSWTRGATNQRSAPKMIGAIANQMYGARHVPVAVARRPATAGAAKNERCPPVK